jgi:hypothetical protein
MEMRIAGRFNIRVVDSKTRLVVAERDVPNVVTCFGIEALLWHFAGDAALMLETAGAGLHGTYTSQGPAHANFKRAMALGSAAGPLLYDDQILGVELVAPYTRQTIANDSVEFVQFYSGVWNRNTRVHGTTKTIPSGVVFSATWAAGFVAAPTNIQEIGLFNSTVLETEDMLAGSNFTVINVTATQEVQATYTISLAQA